MKSGLYANINAKQKRIAAGSGEKMRKPRISRRSDCQSVQAIREDGQDPPIT